MKLASEALLEFVVYYGVLVASLILHEAAHGHSAAWLGLGEQYLGRGGGWNPFVHARRELLGTVVCPVSMYVLVGFMVGWTANGFDPAWARLHRGKHGIVVLAGLLSNLTLVLAGVACVRTLLWMGAFELPKYVNFVNLATAVEGGHAATTLFRFMAHLLSVVIAVNASLVLLHLLPIPPFDTAAVVESLLSLRVSRLYDAMRSSPLFLFGLATLMAEWLWKAGAKALFALLLKILYPGVSYL